MPHKHDRTNKRKSPKSSHCIRLRMSRTRGGSRNSRNSGLTPAAWQQQNARSIGAKSIRDTRRGNQTPHPLNLDKDYDESGMLADIKGVVRNIKGKHVLQIALIAALAQLSLYENPQTVALSLQNNIACQQKGFGPYNPESQLCTTVGTNSGKQIGPPAGSYVDKFVAGPLRLGLTSENPNDNPDYIAAMNAANEINRVIKQDEARLGELLWALNRHNKGKPSDGIIKNSDDADKAFAEKLVLDEKIKSNQILYDDHIRAAEIAEANSRT